MRVHFNKRISLALKINNSQEQITPGYFLLLWRLYVAIKARDNDVEMTMASHRNPKPEK